MSDLVIQSPQDLPVASPIEAVETFFRRYAVLPNNAYLPLALWCVGTYLVRDFDCYPYVALLSPVKRCGKTRVQEILELICNLPRRLTAPTPATIYRMMVQCPTLLLDEVEHLRPTRNASDSQQAILAILNAGHRKGANVARCTGPNNDLYYWPTYGPKVFAAIGRLPDTLSDRSIVITMRRKRASQKVARFLIARVTREAKQLPSIVEWIRANRERIVTAYNTMPDLESLVDRESDIWTPLFAICSVAVPGRIDELHACAISLSRSKEDGDEADERSHRLLADVKSIWKYSPFQHGIETQELRYLLANILEESEWAGPVKPESGDTRERECRITPIELASLLRPYGIYPRQIRFGATTAKGYLLSELQDAWDRYLPSDASQLETLETTHVNPEDGSIHQGETAA